MRFDLNNPRNLATTAIMTALVLGLTLIQVAQTPVGGYIHLGDIAIYFASFAFGPWVGLIAGGLGTGLADVVSGYSVFAPLSLIVHGLQGLVAGWIVRERQTPRHFTLALLSGSAILIVGYFIGESLFFGGPGYAIFEVPWNLVQEAVGWFGVSIYVAVARAYPRLRHAD